MTSGELLVRIAVQGPPPGVEWAVQLGRTDLLPPSKRSVDLEFEVTLRVVDRPDGQLDLRGSAVQGPRNARFIYLNSGTRAGQTTSCWDRRAKVSLEGLRSLLTDETRDARSVVCVAAIAGTSSDGGPACANVPLVGRGWRVLPRVG